MLGTAPLGVLGEGVLDQRGQVVRHLGRHLAEGPRLAEEVLLEDVEHRGRAVVEPQRVHPRERLVEDDAHGVDVGPGVRGLGVELLGRHVERRAQEVLVGGGDPALQLGDAEVDHLHHVGGGDEDVRRLEIAVDHALAVGLGDALRGLVDPAHHVLHGGEGEGIARLVAEGHALDHLEHEVDVVLLDAGLVDADHVDVLDPHQRLGLAGEPGAGLDPARRLRGQHLERAVDARSVDRLVDLHANPPAPSRRAMR